MKVNDRFDRVPLSGLKLPTFKGHVKITLRDLYHTRVIEGENIVTDAIADIFANNYMGAIDTSKALTFAEEWFGGILVYEQAHTLSASNYYIPADSDNHLWAHAGDTAPSTAEIAQQDLKRGSPVRTTRTSNSVTHTWEWGHSQGNSGDRYIRALSLTHKDVGNAGLGSTSDAFKAFSPWKAVQVSELVSVPQNPRAKGNAFAQYDDNHTLFFYIGADGWYDYNKTIASTNKVQVYIRRLPYNKVGLFEKEDGTAESDDTRQFEIETSVDFYFNPSYYFDKANKHLWLFTNMTGSRTYSKTTVYYTKIDCETELEIDHGTIVSDDSDLTFLDIVGSSWSIRDALTGDVAQSNIVKDGNIIYLPVGNGDYELISTSIFQRFSGYKKINMSNNDQDLISFADTTTQDRYFTAVKQGGLVVGVGHVENGGTLYQCNASPLAYNSNERILFNQTGKPIIYATRMPATLSSENATKERYLLANKMLHTTLYNIPAGDVFHKTATESMSIEYTIEET